MRGEAAPIRRPATATKASERPTQGESTATADEPSVMRGAATPTNGEIPPMNQEHTPTIAPTIAIFFSRTAMRFDSRARL
jgi:hypothetical protein